jgi:hypothetical protein
LAKRHVNLILPMEDKIKTSSSSSSESDFDFSNFIPVTNHDHKLVSFTKSKYLRFTRTTIRNKILLELEKPQMMTDEQSFDYSLP